MDRIRMRKFLFSRNMAGFLLVLIAMAGVIRFSPSTAPGKKECRDPQKIANNLTDVLQQVLTGSGGQDASNQIYSELNQYSNPAAVFNLNMKPVIWNDAAATFQGEYSKSVDVLLNGNVIGSVGLVPDVVAKPAKRKTHLALPLLFALLFLGILIVGSDLATVFFGLVLIVALAISPSLSLVFLLAATVYLRGQTLGAVDRWFGILFAGFIVLFFGQLFHSSVNNFQFYEAISHGTYVVALVMGFLASAMFMVASFNWISLLIFGAALAFSPGALIVGLIMVLARFMFRKLKEPLSAVALVVGVATGILKI